MILVTGATGIIGAQILRELVRDNKSVKAIKRASSDTSWTRDINDSVEWIISDVLDIINLDKAFEGVTHVIHCAAIVSFDNSSNRSMHTINIEGTKNMLALSQKHNIQKFIHISSVAALGKENNASVVTENTKWETFTLNTAYGVSKYLSELEVWRAQEEGLPTIILNPSVVIGPGNWNKSSVKLIKHVYSKSPFYFAGSLNYVDVRDVAKIATTFLFNKTEKEQYILNAGKTSYKIYFSLIAQAFNIKAPSLKISHTLAIFVASILGIVKFITGITSNINKEAALLNRLTNSFSSAKVEKELNYKFISVENSIKWACEQLENKVINA